MYQKIKTKIHDVALAIDAKWDALPQSIRDNVISAGNSFITGFVGGLIMTLTVLDTSNIEASAIFSILTGAFSAAFRGGLRSLTTFAIDSMKSWVSTVKELRGKK